MESVVCRLLPYAVADGPHNMAAEETLLTSAVGGLASLRFYGWFPPTLSLGYFQPERLRHSNPQLAALPYVRRPSGGDTLVHHHEVTYALALPAGPSWQSGESWAWRMHRILAAALNTLGVPARLHEPAADQAVEGPLCFHHFTAGDLLLGSAKIGGSAQRRQRGALLQHGAILLAQSPHTPSLPGIRELIDRELTVEETCQAIRDEFVQWSGWELAAADWTTPEQRLIDELATTKYTREAWNRKR